MQKTLIILTGLWLLAAALVRGEEQPDELREAVYASAQAGTADRLLPGERRCLTVDDVQIRRESSDRATVMLQLTVYLSCEEGAPFDKVSRTERWVRRPDGWRRCQGQRGRTMTLSRR